MSLEGHVAFITGASRGLGKATALALARAGADVVIAARSETPPSPNLPGSIHETAQAVEALGRRALAVRCDIARGEDVDAAAAKALETFGKVDILVLNASLRLGGTLADMAMPRWDAVQQANFRTAVSLVKAFLPGMREQRWGHVIVVTQAPGGSLGSGTPLGYALAKAALSQLVQGAAEELAGYGIAINAVYPGGSRATEGARAFRPIDPARSLSPDVFGDAALAVVSADPAARSGQFLRDDEVLRAEGVTDFSRYAVTAE